MKVFRIAWVVLTVLLTLIGTGGDTEPGISWCLWLAFPCYVVLYFLFKGEK